MTARRRIAALALEGLLIVALVVAVPEVPTPSAHADQPYSAPAQVTRGFNRQVTINDYGVARLGLFKLTGTNDNLWAACFQAQFSHDTNGSAYVFQPNTWSSPEADYLLWWYASPHAMANADQATDIDAAALQSLIWFYSRSTRRGFPNIKVWNDDSSPRQPYDIAPDGPAWDSLPAYGPRFPIGIQIAGDFGDPIADRVEHRAYEMFVDASRYPAPWTLQVFGNPQDATAVLRAANGVGVPNQPTSWIDIDNGITLGTTFTDGNGLTSAPPHGPQISVRVVAASTPDVHRELGSTTPHRPGEDFQSLAVGTGYPRSLDFPSVKVKLPTLYSVAASSHNPGRQVVWPGASVIADDVQLLDLTPGSTYRVDGELLDTQANEIVSTASQQVVAGNPQPPGGTHVRLQFDAPARTTGHRLAVLLQLSDLTDPNAINPVYRAEDPNNMDESILVSSPRITTDASAVIQALPGTPVPLTDDITISGLAPPFRSTPAETAIGTATLYGPFAQFPDASSCTQDKIVGTADVAWSSDGRTTTPPVVVTAPGYYTWLARAVTSFGNIATHPCGQPLETPTVLNPSLATTARATLAGTPNVVATSDTTLDVPTANDYTAGAEDLWDIAAYRDLVPGGHYTATVTWQRRAADGTCAPALPAMQVSFIAAAPAGQVAVGPVSSGALSGTVVAFETLTDDATGQVVANHADCDDLGQRLYGHPTVDSAASDAADGDEVLDHAGTVRDRVELRGLTIGNRYVLHASLYDTTRQLDVAGPVDDEFIAASDITTRTVELSLAGSVVDGHQIVARLTLDDLTAVGVANPVARHDAVDTAAETTAVRRPLAITTNAAGRIQRPAGATVTLTDEVTLIGLAAPFRDTPAETATGTATLYGPFSSLPGVDACTSDRAVGSVPLRWASDGTVTSPPLIVHTAGAYTWVAAATTSTGRSATHACGMANETVEVFLPTIGTQAGAVAAGTTNVHALDATTLDVPVERSFVTGYHDAWDTVAWSGLMPGTYTAIVAWQDLLEDGTCRPTSSIATVTFTVAPGVHDGAVAVGPASTSGWRGPKVAFETVTTANGDVVATHADCRAVGQHLLRRSAGIATAVVSLDPTGLLPDGVHATALTGGRLGDRITYRDLPPGDYTATIRWQRRLANGTCAPTGWTTSSHFTVPAATKDGTTEVAAQPSPSGITGTLVAFEQITDATGSVVADESDCASTDQSVWVAGPSIATMAEEQAPAGASGSDTGIVMGLAHGQYAIRLRVFRYIPGGATAREAACDGAAVIDLTYPIDGSGAWPSPRYSIPSDEPAGVQYVNLETLLTPDGVVLAQDGCGSAPETTTITRTPRRGRLLVLSS